MDLPSFMPCIASFICVSACFLCLTQMSCFVNILWIMDIFMSMSLFFVNASFYTWNALPSQPHSSKASPDDKLFMSPFLMHACSHSSGQEWTCSPLGSPSTLNAFLLYHLPDCAKSLKLVVYIVFTYSLDLSSLRVGPQRTPFFPDFYP